MAELLGLAAQLPGFAPPQGAVEPGRAPVPGFAALLQGAPQAAPASPGASPAPSIEALPADGIVRAPAVPVSDASGASVLHPVRQVATGRLSYLAHGEAAPATRSATGARAAEGSPAMPTSVPSATRSAPVTPRTATERLIASAAAAREATSTAARLVRGDGAGSLAARASAAAAPLFPAKRLQLVVRDGEATVLLRDYALDADERAALVAAIRQALPADTLTRIVCNGELVWSKEIPCP